MRTIYVSPDFPLNRRMRKDIRRGKLQVVREGGERLSLGGGIPSGKGRGFRTAGSPLVCMADNGAEVGGGLGGGNNSEKKHGDKPEKKKNFLARLSRPHNTVEGKLMRHMRIEKMLRRPLGADINPWVSVFTHTTSGLENDEKRFEKEWDDVKSEMGKKWEEYEKESDDVYDYYADALADEYADALAWHKGICPLLARYAALVMVMSMVEWHVQITSRHESEEIRAFLRLLSEEGQNDFRKNMLKEAVVRIQKLQQPSVSDLLKQLAEKAGIPGDSNEMQTHRDLVSVRNVIAHCGGNIDMARNPDAIKGAAERLKLGISDSIPVNDGENTTTVKLFANHIIIKAGDLNPHIETMDALLDKLRARPYL